MPLMASLGKAFTFLIAAQLQAIGIIMAAWWIGEWLNENHPLSFNWYAITFPIGVLAVAQTFYMVIRHAYRVSKGTAGAGPKDKGAGTK